MLYGCVQDINNATSYETNVMPTLYEGLDSTKFVFKVSNE